MGRRKKEKGALPLFRSYSPTVDKIQPSANTCPLQLHKEKQREQELQLKITGTKANFRPTAMSDLPKRERKQAELYKIAAPTHVTKEVTIQVKCLNCRHAFMSSFSLQHVTFLHFACNPLIAIFNDSSIAILRAEKESNFRNINSS